jgi:hypothetical protein
LGLRCAAVGEPFYSIDVAGASLARNAAVKAISPGSPNRSSGLLAVKEAVLVGPGLRMSIRMPAPFSFVTQPYSHSIVNKPFLSFSINNLIIDVSDNAMKYTMLSNFLK